jgi:hypothetical protein
MENLLNLKNPFAKRLSNFENLLLEKDELVNAIQTFLNGILPSLLKENKFIMKFVILTKSFNLSGWSFLPPLHISMKVGLSHPISGPLDLVSHAARFPCLRLVVRLLTQRGVPSQLPKVYTRHQFYRVLSPPS